MGLFRAIGFLSVLPLPRALTRETEPRGVMAYFSIVGALLGALVALLGFLLSHIWSNLTTATACIVALAIITGGLHLDGLADTADGLWGGRDREKKLAIMEDSHIGTFGALAVIGCLLLKIALLAELSASFQWRALILAVTLGRWAMVNAALFFPSAKAHGLGWTLKNHLMMKDLILATAVMMVLAAVLVPFWGLAIQGGIFLASLGIGWGMTRSLGGMTGDTYGATCEISEMLALGMLSLVGGSRIG